MDKDPPFVKELDARAASGDEACREARSCLQAMRSVICQQGCAGSAVAYFAATVAALQRQLEQKAGESGAGTTSSLLLILRRSMAAVPAGVVHSRINDVIAVLDRLLKAPPNEDIVRQVLGCLAAVANLAFDAGSRPNRKVLKPLLVHLCDKREPIRKRAQLSAAALVRRAAGANDGQTLEAVVQHLVEIIAAANPDRTLNELPVQHALALLRTCSAELPAEGFSQLCVALIGLPAKLGQHPCCTEAFEFIAKHLNRELIEDDEEEMSQEEQLARMRLALNLLPRLLQVPCNMLNVAYLVAYVRIIAASVAVLAEEMSLRSAPSAAESVRLKVAGFSKLLSLFVERDPTLLKRLREECSAVLKVAGSGGDVEFLDALLTDACRPLLGYERKGAWQHALPVLAAAFDAIGEMRANRVSHAEVGSFTTVRFQQATELLKELIASRDKAKTAELAVFGRELSDCLGSAFGAFGPENMLTITKLELLEHSLADPAFEQKSRSWLLLLMRVSCQRSSLAFFSTKLLGLAGSLKARAAQAEATSEIIAKKYVTLMEQVWALLPSFCEEPLDLAAAMLSDGGRFAKQLVAVLLNEPRLRDAVWLSFKRLCGCVLEPASKLSRSLQESNRSCLQTLAPRVLPEMFSAIVKMSSEAEGQDESITSHSHHLAIDALHSYAKVAESALVANFFKTAVSKLLKATTGQDASVPLDSAVPLADIANALVPHLPTEGLEIAVKVFSPMLSGANVGDDKASASIAANLQKSGYRAVAAVLRHPALLTEGQADAGKVVAFGQVLRDARQTCTTPALKARLVAIQSFLEALQVRLAPHLTTPEGRKSWFDCLTDLLPEVLFHLRDQSTSVREAARGCLRIAATTAIAAELQTEIVTLVSAGLAGLTPFSKASAVDALSRLLYENNAEMPVALQDRLIKLVLLLLQDMDAQVWRSALKFAKVVVFISEKETLIDCLPMMLKLFDSKHLASAKMLVRRIVERLAKVLDADLLSQAFPPAHLPLLQYVQKQLLRRQRPKSVLENVVEPEAEEDEISKGRKSRKAKDVNMTGAAKESGLSYDAFDQDGDEEPVARVGNRKRVREATAVNPVASKEPPTSRVMAHEAVQTLLDAWEAESDSDGEGGKHRRSRQTNRRELREGKRKHEAVEMSTWIHEDQNAPIDFMSADAAHSVLTVRPPQMKRQRGDEVGPAGATSRVEALRRSGLKFAPDGRLVVEETQDEEGEPNEEGRAKFDLGTLGNVGLSKVGALSRLAERRRLRAVAKARALAARRGGHQVKGLDTYRPGKKHASGDAKRKGQKLEPYAYLRLNAKVTKEKFKDRATKSFARVLTGKKKSGVLKGLKAKVRDKKFKDAKESKKKRRAAFSKKSVKRGSR